MTEHVTESTSGLTLNGPLEVGVRALTLLVESYPAARTLEHLVLLDHALLHSADWGGPRSLHPPLPLRVSELGVRREALLAGLQLMTRVQLVELVPLEYGLCFRANDAAQHFLDVLVAHHARALRAGARWSVERFGALPVDGQRSTLRALFNSWDAPSDATSERDTAGAGEQRNP